jgi:galactose mutarotase-like enzyme
VHSPSPVAAPQLTSSPPDHNLVFNAPATSTAKPRVVLTSPDSRVSLRFFTNQSSVQVYTAAGFDGTSGRKPHHQGHDNPVGGYEQFGTWLLTS